jgi:hypothetical protein
MEFNASDSQASDMLFETEITKAEYEKAFKAFRSKVTMA